MAGFSDFRQRYAEAHPPWVNDVSVRFEIECMTLIATAELAPRGFRGWEGVQ
jgi:hypothetical protein